MRRFNKPRISINLKIWGAIMLTAALIIGALWLLQVVFMEEYYVKVKGDDIIADAKSVVEILQEDGVQSGMESIYQIAAEKTLCVDISSITGATVLVCEGLGDNCFLHMWGRNKAAVLLEAQGNSGRYVLTDIVHPTYQTRYNTCSILVNAGEETYFVTLTATLAPIVEATVIIKRQLVYVSVILALVATVIAFLVARSLTKPIRKINDAARAVANGNLDIEVEVRSNDEIGELSESFTHMTHELSKVSVLQRELVANISHDIRTPLTMIRGYAEAIKDITGEDRDLRNHQLDIIVVETNRLNMLASDALDLSLMQAGQIALNVAPFDIVQKLGEILGRFELYEQMDEFEFSLESKAGDCVTVLADELRIEQVIYNLINNAVNHIGEQKQITARLSAVEDGIIVEIVDTGVGISQEDLPMIWDRYYKPYKKTGKKSAGTGLGLSIVKAILINHGARFGVYSTLGEGSTFWFVLKSEGE